MDESRETEFSLRPPGALDEAAFQRACIKCGQCVEACPYGTLDLASAGGKHALGTPFFEPRAVPCYMCPGVPCAAVCPSGALDREAEIERARMGLAVLVDQESCVAFQGLRCEVCYRVCPKLGRAITLEFQPQERTGKHAFFQPVVHHEECTGCGICEHACILEEAAIRVLPPELARGRIGANYRLGWKEEAEISQDFTESDAEGRAPTDKQAAEHTRKVLKTLEDLEGIIEQ